VLPQRGHQGIIPARHLHYRALHHLAHRVPALSLPGASPTAHHAPHLHHRAHHAPTFTTERITRRHLHHRAITPARTRTRAPSHPHLRTFTTARISPAGITPPLLQHRVPSLPRAARSGAIPCALTRRDHSGVDSVAAGRSEGFPLFGLRAQPMGKFDERRLVTQRIAANVGVCPWQTVGKSATLESYAHRLTTTLQDLANSHSTRSTKATKHRKPSGRAGASLTFRDTVPIVGGFPACRPSHPPCGTVRSNACADPPASADRDQRFDQQGTRLRNGDRRGSAPPTATNPPVSTARTSGTAISADQSHQPRSTRPSVGTARTSATATAPIDRDHHVDQPSAYRRTGDYRGSAPPTATNTPISPARTSRAATRPGPPPLTRSQCAGR
jgi:hypothetical protein